MTRMQREALEAPAAVERMLRRNRGEVGALIEALRRQPPPFALTVARGSSDHAAVYARYAIETLQGVVTASAAPSVVTVYRRRLQLQGALVLALSQSGESPDLVEVVRHAREQGALTVALVNREDAPLAAAAERVLPLCAGVERSVAATKSFIAELAAVAQIAAVWSGEGELIADLDRLPDALSRAAGLDWSGAIDPLRDADRTLVIGRGYAYAVALEAAHKLKETSALHAEAFSSADLLHGPVALVEPGFPVWVFAPDDASLPGVAAVMRDLGAKGAHAIVASPAAEATAAAITSLPAPESVHPLLDPIPLVQAFYPFAAMLAEARGADPDRPPHLTKVTRTT